MATETPAVAKTKVISPEAAVLPAPPSEAAAGAKRLVSLDAFRGWTMFWIVGGAALVSGCKRSTQIL
jgi:hypothetical protein